MPQRGMRPPYGRTSCMSWQQHKKKLVQVLGADGNWIEVTNKVAMEEAIMNSTRKKYAASHGTSFMVAPLVS